MKKIVGLFVLVGLLGSLMLASVNIGRAQVSIDLPNINTNNHKPTVPFNPLCMQNAVDKRDTAIIASLDTYSAAAKTALTTRKTELKAAWALTEKSARNAALKSAWKKYRDSIRTARKTFRDAKRTAWKQFSTDRKACKESSRSEDNTGQGVDETL